MRLFTGISVDQDFIDCSRDLKSLNAGVRGVRWVPGENLHLTTCFIGENSPSELDRLLKKTEDFTKIFSRCTLHLSRICIWPSRNPYMVWALYEESPAFDRFYHGLERELLGKTAQGPVKPHVTLARFKEFSDYKNLVLEKTEFPQELEMVRLNFYESILKPEGPVYRIIRSFDLL